ncbi:MAG: hypothetical protein GWP08_10085 [Nitrospiraceae bacterium]|nr:hypothetical protein [Nitrospiraceae bacterium]
MKPSVVAVLDVGKTNKKVSLYDRQFNVVASERTTVDPKQWQGVEVEDTEALLGWFRSALKKLSDDWAIRSIAITTHGATFALLDDKGALALPVISYTAARGEEVQEEFYETFGDRTDLHRATSSPDVGFANMAKVMYFVKTRLPEAWAKCRHALFYGPYLGYELTGKMGCEPTYPGNHTYFWDFAAKTWSEVAHELGADTLFPSELASPWDRLGMIKPDIAEECGLPADCKVTYGIHDSNANLLPYLARGYDNFMLNSTGTWCVLMRPCDTLNLTDGEVGAKVFFNLDALTRPVRTCIFPAGMEYDTFRGFTSLKDESNVEIVRRVVENKSLFVIPGALPDASAFPGATPRVIQGGTVRLLDDLRERSGKPMTPAGQAYYGALNLALALATRRMLEWCGVQAGTQVFIEGGFANNKMYCALLATLCPEQTFALTNLKEGTSFGAALTGWMLSEGLGLEQIGGEFAIETTPVAAEDFGDLASYEAAFKCFTAE